ncbi:MAG: type IX secretion system sortase PorU [Bacteroidaceae bacterium]|nr:type IX secretion system sortase PorU [Bacteroidaceae bacterium]
MKRLFLIPLFLFLVGLTRAQQPFTQLDWNVLRLDSVLPHYTEVVPLETDYHLYKYHARVRFPEWAPLTDEEAEVARRFDDEIADTLRINTFVGISRGQGLIDLDFVPVVRREGSYQKLLSGKIEIVPEWLQEAQGPQRLRRVLNGRGTSTRSETAERWASHSVLASGKWAKVSLTEDGIYHLTNSQLRSMGFSNPQNIRVYGYGGHLQETLIEADSDWDDLCEVALLPVADGYLFHANGLVHWKNGQHVVNHYARTATYFITEAATAATAIGELEVESASEEATEITTCMAGACYNPQEYAWYQGGRQLYENYDYAAGNARNYQLDLPIYPTDEEATLRIAFTASNATATEVQPYFNGAALTSFTINALATEYFAAVENIQKLTVDAPLNSSTIRITTTSGQHARLNYVELSYTGQLKLDANRPYIQFSHTNDGSAEVLCIEVAEGQTPEVWRLEENRSPACRLAATESNKDGKRILRVAIPADAESHRYTIFDSSAPSVFPQPTSGEAVANQDLHATDSVDMVIITPASGIFDTQAQRLAAVHEELDSLRIAVVRADCIYNEFSSGTPDATAYRRYLKMLYDRGLTNGTAPRYLLLFGDCAWDNRMLTATWRTSDPANFLLCYESENSLHDINSYVMEDYFGLLDDGEGGSLLRDKCDLGIGRFPIRTQKEATALVDKTIRYLRSEEAGNWKNIVCFMGDDGDSNLHEQMADDVANQVATAHPELEVRKVIWDAYTRESTASGFRYPEVTQIIKKQMEEGALMMNYTGHASTYTLSHEQVLRVENFADFTAPRPPLWVTAACDVMPFDTQKENFGETALLNETGAAIAFYGTTRTVLAGENATLNKAYCAAIFGTDEEGRGNRLGDAGRIAKVNVIEAGQLGVNKLHYALLGDPALRLGSLTSRVVLDSINGTAVAELPEDFTLHAGGIARLAGHVAGADGQQLDSFSGSLSVRLYDSQNTIVCNKYDNESDAAFTFQTYDKILYNGEDSVRSGRFALSCPIPLDINYSNAAGRLLFYALSSDKRTEANGYSHDFLLGGTEEGLDDTEGPVIWATLGGEDFQDGDVVGATPYFQATLEDESGINSSGNGVGHDLELVVDSDATRTYILNDYFVNEIGDYRRGTVAYSLPQLEAGEHELTFRAWDMLNNPSTATLHFVVDPKKAMHLTELSVSNNPARTSTQFLLTYDRPGSTCSFTIEVFDFTGRVVWSYSTTGSSATGFYAIPWGLSTNTGCPVHTGIYLYRARVRCDESEEATKAQKLIINRSF